MAIPQVFKLALPAGCGDGQLWAEEKFNQQHERLEDNNDKCDEWKFKLGGMLRDEVLGKEHQGRPFFLENFPDHYHLRAKKTAGKKKVRSDYYLYGYPGGKDPKPFRSPNEFFPHLLWIVGGSNDRATCSCRYCTPVQTPPVWYPAEQLQVPDAGLSAQTGTGLPAPASQGGSMNRTASGSGQMAGKPPGSSQLKLQPSVTPAPPAFSTAQQAIATQKKITPVPVPTIPGQLQSMTSFSEQTPLAQQVVPTIFRAGEVVWFKNSNAWRIGAVVQIEPGSSAAQNYSIKPLAHALLNLDVTIKAETDMRPFLAFSVPPVNMKDLQGKRIKDIDWGHMQTALAGTNIQRQELLGLEASKMAVIEVDHSYSTFNSITEAHPNPAIQRVGGVFLGAERISVGEAVRVRLNPQETNPAWQRGLPVVMVIHGIAIGRDGLFFQGDIYRLEETANQQARSTPPLPAELRREKAFRDGVKRPFGIHYDWILVQQNIVKPENMIKGRFYETSKLMPIIDADKYRMAQEKGVIEDVQAYLNNRMDSTGQYIGRTRNRRRTLSGVVPAQFTFTLGPGVAEDA